jgi:hypothetical protein
VRRKEERGQMERWSGKEEDWGRGEERKRKRLWEMYVLRKLEKLSSPWEPYGNQ